MKKLLIIVLSGFALPCRAQSTMSPVGQFIHDAIATSEATSNFNLAGEKLGGIYVPLRTLDKPLTNMLDIGGGAVFGGAPQGVVAVRINLPQISNGIFGTKWFVNSTHGPTLPTLFIGPEFKDEWPFKKWTWKKDAFLTIGIPLSTIGVLGF